MVFKHRFYYDLVQVEGASLNVRRKSELTVGIVRPQLTTRQGDIVWFSWAWTARPHRLQAFVADINGALAVARTRMTDARAKRQPSGLPNVQAPP